MGQTGVSHALTPTLSQGERGSWIPACAGMTNNGYGETGKEVTVTERAPSGSENSTMEDRPTHVGEPG